MDRAASSMFHAWIKVEDDERTWRKGGIGILAGRVILGRMVILLFIKAMDFISVNKLLVVTLVLPSNGMFPIIL
jgi:hypothetical protein